MTDLLEMRSPLRWAGGKIRILPEIVSNLPYDFEDSITSYVEPFVGGGAVMFYFLSNYEFEDVTISDLNMDLINFYKNLKEQPDSLRKEYNKLSKIFKNSPGKETYYYNLRKVFNENISSGLEDRLTTENAALLLFINRTSYNGIFRVNKNGLFNVPFGKKSSVQPLSEEHVALLSTVLENAKIKRADFETTLKDINANSKTFIYLDPPYVTGHLQNGFISYNETLFPWESQIKLVNLVKKYTKKGVRCMISNANSDSIKKLYSVKGFSTIPLERKCCIGGPVESRGDYSELIVTNYSLGGGKDGKI